MSKVPCVFLHFAEAALKVRGSTRAGHSVASSAPWAASARLGILLSQDPGCDGAWRDQRVPPGIGHPPGILPLPAHPTINLPELGWKGQVQSVLHPLSPPRNLCSSSGCPGLVNQDGETQNRNVRLKSRTGRRGLLKERRESGSLKAHFAFLCLQSLGYHLSQKKKVSLLKKSLLQEDLAYISLSKTHIRARHIYFKCTKGCQTIRDCMKRPSKQNIRTSANICVFCRKLNQSLIMSLWRRVD